MIQVFLESIKERDGDSDPDSKNRKDICSNNLVTIAKEIIPYDEDEFL